MQATEPDHLINLLGAFATTVTDELTGALEGVAGGGGAAPAALLAVDTWPGRSVNFLGDVLGLTHSGTVRLVDRLVSDDLLERRAGADGRSLALRLTRRGRRVARRARRSRYEILDRLVAVLGDAERETLGSLLERMLAEDARSRTEARHACRLCDHTVCRGEACPIGASVDAA